MLNETKRNRHLRKIDLVIMKFDTFREFQTKAEMDLRQSQMDGYIGGLYRGLQYAKEVRLCAETPIEIEDDISDEVF